MWRRRPAWLALSLEGVLVAGLTLAAAAWVLRLWRADLTVPLRYPPLDDTKFYLMLAKGIVEHGWYSTNSSLGAPFGQQLFDFPQGADNLNLLIIRGLALLTSSPALVVNLFFLLTFPMTSLSAHVALRRLGIGAPAAAVPSVLFSLLPYHFFRGESHLLLSAYYAVPLSSLLFLELLAGTPLLPHRPGAKRVLAWSSPRSWATIGLCVVIGSENLYYATFALVLLGGAILVALALRQWRSLRDGVLVIVLILAALAVNLAPSLIYRAEHGANTAVARTALADETTTEAFALRLTNLVLPVPDSRIAPLRHLAARYDDAIAPGYCEACYASLGAVGTVGFGWLAICALSALAGGTGWLRSRRLLGHAGGGVAIALGVGTVGGLSSLSEFFLTPDIRAWNRISVFIAFLSLLAVGMLLDRLISRPRTRWWSRVPAALLLPAVLVLGVFEQTTPQFVPDYPASAHQWRSDADFVAALEHRLPRDASVFQLPYVPFPEGYADTPVGDRVAAYATKYEPVRGYLHSDTLRWSYGATKGRASDWSAQLAGQPLPLVTAAAAAAGFDGVWLDPAGFEPPQARRVLTGLRVILGAPLASPDEDLFFFDLRPYRRRLQHTHTARQLAALQTRTLHPLRTGCAPGGVSVVNPGRGAEPATLSVNLTDGRVLRRRLRFAPGRSVVRLTAMGASHEQVRSATLADAAVAPFSAGMGAAADVVAGLTGPPCPT